MNNSIAPRVQGPLSRFGDTAANAGMLALLDSYDSTAALPIWVKTLSASAAAAGFRIVLMPVDALKTTLQVEGAKGLAVLGAKVRGGGPLTLWRAAPPTPPAPTDSLLAACVYPA